MEVPKAVTDLSLPPLPTGAVNVPSVEQIRARRAQEPDISGLNFSKLPAPAKPVAAPAPVAKKVQDSLPPMAPVAPNEPMLPPPPKVDNSPLLVPVPKPPAPLPPTVTNRLDALNPRPAKQGVVSDKTTTKDHVAEQAAKKEAEKKAKADAALKAETEMAAAKKEAEAKAKADAEAAKKAALKLPPASLPPPLPSIPAMPDPLAKSPAPVKLDTTKIGALPSISAAPPVAVKPTAPVLPKAPVVAPSNPNLPKLPTLTIPGTQPDKPLPSLTAITGGGNPTTQDILQPRDAVDSSPLLPANMTPPPALPTMDDSVPIAKRELPEINIGSAAPKPPALPAVKAATKPVLPPALPSIPVAPSVTPKTPTPVVVASAPAVSTSGNLETSIAFSANSSALTDAGKSTLSGIADKARKSQKKVRIVGYAAGDADKATVARKTAFARANIIRAFLLSKGMSDSMIHAQALGNQVPQDKADIFLQ